MSGSGIITTIVGRAATTPREVHGGRVPYTSFRLATAPRYYDRSKEAWVEGRTEWLTVKVFRDTALNVAGSVLKGQPVVVQGRLKTEEWLGENGPRTGLVIEAVALGHDLTRGRATFVRTSYRTDDADGAGPGAGPSDEAPHAESPEGDGPEGDGSAAPDDPGGPPAGEDPWAVDARAPLAGAAGDGRDGIDLDQEEPALTP